MNTRLLQLLQAENISQSQFADSIGVARASVSHIIAGRNKPGFDFIENLSRRYPTVNLEWLITGKGKMYKNSAPAPEPQDDLFAFATDIPQDTVVSQPDEPEVVVPVKSPAPKIDSEIKSSKQSMTVQPVDLSADSKAHRKRCISKIIVFFDDGSYQELK